MKTFHSINFCYLNFHHTRNHVEEVTLKYFLTEGTMWNKNFKESCREVQNGVMMS